MTKDCTCSCDWQRFFLYAVPLLTIRDPRCEVHGDTTVRARIKERCRQLAEERGVKEQKQHG